VTLSVDALRLCFANEQGVHIYERTPGVSDFVHVKSWSAPVAHTISSHRNGCVYGGIYYGTDRYKEYARGIEFDSNDQTAVSATGELFGSARQVLGHAGRPLISSNGKVIVIGTHVYSLEPRGYAYLQDLGTEIYKISHNGSHLFAADGRVFTHA
jgi:hypothetical protein